MSDAISLSDQRRVCMLKRMSSEDKQLRANSWDRSINHCDQTLAMPDLRSHKSGMLSRAAAFNAYRDMSRFVVGLPKAELHLHIEGTLTPSLAYTIAQRNGLSQDSLSNLEVSAAVKRREEFTSLYPFLVEYSNSSQVLKTEADFYDMASNYLERAHENRVLHVEMFFDPQTHCFYDVSGDMANPRVNSDSSQHLELIGAEYDADGVGPSKLDFGIVYSGLARAIRDAKKFDPPVNAKLIMCFLRDRSENEAMSTLHMVEPYLVEGLIVAVGLDNREGAVHAPDGTVLAPANPPTKFINAYARAKALGLKCVAHAGEEGGADFVRDAWQKLGCARIDHGVRSMEDPELVAQLAEAKVPLTVCPCSNHRLQVIPRYFCGENPVGRMMQCGLHVTLNSDDPAYFFMGAVDGEGRARDSAAPVYDGFLSSNYVRSARDCGLSPDQLVTLALNSFEACFVTPEQKQSYRDQIATYCSQWE